MSAVIDHIYPARSCQQNPSVNQQTDFLPFLLCHSIWGAHQSGRSHQPLKCSLCTCARLCSTRWTPCCSPSGFLFCLWRRTPPRSKGTPTSLYSLPPLLHQSLTREAAPQMERLGHFDTSGPILKSTLLLSWPGIQKHAGAAWGLHQCMVLLFPSSLVFPSIKQVAAPEDLKSVSRPFNFPSSSLLATLLQLPVLIQLLLQVCCLLRETSTLVLYMRQVIATPNCFFFFF